VIWNLTLLALGLALVARGGDLFVDSSVHIARILNVPRIVIGGTLVSLCTTMPELLVSVTASFMGDSGIAFGNAIGSAIANIGLVLGAVAILSRVQIDRDEFKIRSAWLVFATLLVISFSWSRYISRGSGMMLFLLSLVYLISNLWRSKQADKKEVSGATPDTKEETLTRSAIRFLVGAVLVLTGSRCLVVSGIALAEALHIPSAIIGLSVIAVGTSLPELVTGITSARKGVPDLAIGNIVGANVLNLAMIVGVAAMINPLTLTRFTQVYSFPWLVLFVGGMILMLARKGSLGKREGVVLLSLYAIYVAGLFTLPALIRL